MNRKRLPTDPVQRAMARLIRDHGWAVTGVAEDNSCHTPGCTSVHEEQDPFLYTVGLSAAGLPELLLEHVPYQTAALVLNGLARQSLAAALTPETLYRVDGIASSFTVSAVRPGEALTVCKLAKVFYGARLRVLRVHPSEAVR